MEPVPRPDITFARKDPQTYVVLIARAGPEGVLIGTRAFKPPGTEFATILDLFEAGYAQADLLREALGMLGLQERDRLLSRFVEWHNPEARPAALRIAQALGDPFREGSG